MAYCPKCGNKVDETMAFCPRCGASLKMETAWQAGPTSTSPPAPPYRYEKQEKHEKPEKHEEKHEKPGGGYIGLLIAGLVIVFIGLVAYVNVTTNFLSGPEASAVVLVIIGIIIVVAGIYFAARTRSRNPVPT